MDISAIKKYFDELAEKNPKCDNNRLLQAYQDILILENIYEETIKKKINGSDAWEFAKEGLMEEAKELKSYERELVTLLRSMYLIASSFINILLYDCNYKDDISGQITLAKIFTSKRIDPHTENDIMNLFDYADSAYLLQVFRNCCIAHSDVPRTFSVISRGKDVNNRVKSIRLFSSPIAPVNNSTVNDSQIQGLLINYGLKLNGHPDIITVNEITDLFYKVPLIKNGARNFHERSIIYNIIKSRPCMSMTYVEIINCIDKFVIGICSSV